VPEPEKVRHGFCIFVDTFFQGAVPVELQNDTEFVVYDTEVEAQREIADVLMIRLQEFLDGHRDFEDATEVEDYILEVDLYSDGSVVDEHGRRFKPEDVR
jgi:hypothetical protein